MKTKKQAAEIVNTLEAAYPMAECILDSEGAWQLLVAVRLSAQCTDLRVNATTPILFGKFPTIDALADADPKEIEEIVKPCGLGCRDTLRFEVGLPLYGDELTDEITPLEAGLGMFAKLDKDFIGRDALVAQKAEGLKRKIVGIELKDKAIPRHGYPVEVDGKVIGEVTTGYNSISTGKSVCMAMVDIEYAKLDTEVAVRIRKKVFPGVVTKKRFYDKNYKK